MKLSAQILGCLSVMLCVLMEFAAARDMPSTISEDRDETVGRRVRRSLPDLIARLLTSSRRTYSAEHYKVYFKKGGFRDAIKDFRKLKPTDIKKNGIFTIGKVGDDTLVEVYKREFTNRAEMRIIHATAEANPKGVDDIHVIEYAPKSHNK